MTSTETASRIPVTVLTGFLGAGKTTLLNRILTEQHGHRIAVIENEYGEIGIDNELVIDADEEIFEMNNGCICCTVRGDLIRILGRLVKRRDRFDRILVETTGLADPGPVAQTFFVDDELRRKFVLDGIVTLIDAGHFDMHIDDSPECAEQLAFADALVLNKVDLISDEEQLQDLQKRLREVNPMASFFTATNADVPIDKLLDLGGFDLDRALSMDEDFLTPEYPFEWGGIANFDAPTCTLTFQPGADASIKAVILPLDEEQSLENLQEKAVLLFSGRPTQITSDKTLRAGPLLSEIELSLTEPTQVTFEAPTQGRYAFFMEHFPEEFDLVVHVHKDNAKGEELQWQDSTAYLDDHEHDETVGSVGLSFAGALDLEKLNTWMSELLMEHGPDIFRMKGVLHMAGSDQRYVFQGVHMLFDAKPQRRWRSDEERVNEMIFIGRELDSDLLNQRFRQCLA